MSSERERGFQLSGGCASNKYERAFFWVEKVCALRGNEYNDECYDYYPVE
jgi:hypothetical protein